jgi:uncharacterized protein YerC
MPHVSKTKLPKNVQDDIFGQLAKYISRAKDPTHAEAVLSGLLTDTEKLMLAKRLAIIALLHEGNSMYSIANLLAVSPSTVERLYRDKENGQHDFVEDLYTDIGKKHDFLSVIETILSAGLPPIAGKGRWKWLYKNTPKKSSSSLRTNLTIYRKK